jgi:hypothetical protein
MATSTSTKTIIATDNARIAGIQKYCMGQASILVENATYTPAQAVAIYQADLDAIAEVTAAELALAEARAKAKTAALARQQFDHGFKLSIEGAYGGSPTTMGTFGIAVAAPKAPTAKVKAEAVTKALATRQLRGTLGKKQKAALPTASETTPVATPSAGGATGK